MNHLPPPPHPPSPTHGVLRPPMPPNTAPVAQPQPQASITLGLQPAQLQQQPHANCNTVTQAAAIPGVNAAQSAPSKPGSRTWRWFLKIFRVCAALLVFGSTILFIYYQFRADRRDELDHKYTVHSHNLSVWEANKEYCDFKLSHDVSLYNKNLCYISANCGCVLRTISMQIRAWYIPHLLWFLRSNDGCQKKQLSGTVQLLQILLNMSRSPWQLYRF
jgi:hypothetical protein